MTGTRNSTSIPEIAGGRGFSGMTGITNFPNGEMPRVASAAPKQYVARLYITHDFGFGSERESVASHENQLAGERPSIATPLLPAASLLPIFFDNNRYMHDPRTQFMGWGIMYNGAWDYASDTRSYVSCATGPTCLKRSCTTSAPAMRARSVS